MTMQYLRQYILDQTGIDVLSKSRKQPIPTTKKVFIQIARKKCFGESNIMASYIDIGSFLNLNHSTVIHHYNSDLTYEFKQYTFLADIYYQYFERTEKTADEYQKEINQLKKELEEIKKMIGF
jgi:hypothetical protein